MGCAGRVSGQLETASERPGTANIFHAPSESAAISPLQRSKDRFKGAHTCLDDGDLMAEIDTHNQSLAARRPLSPHLQIYRPMLTMMMSIVHRITGAALYAGTLLLAWYLIALASGPAQFATVSAVYGSALGLLVLFGFTWALLHHLLGGIRHLVWDLGHGMDARGREFLAKGTLVGGLTLTVLIWLAAFIAG
jgi:succinate dehydrogenase / fumarate reductase cytochrome b subunit